MKIKSRLMFAAVSVLLASCLLPMASAQAAPASPAQSSLASETAAFATLLATDPVVAKALDAHNLADALKLVGKPGGFQGTVTSTYSPKTHDVVILDFDKEYRTALTAAVKPADYAKFPDLTTLRSKRVLVTGVFTAPKGVPTIVLTDPTQVRIIQ